ncbi:MAG: molybdopterin molybdotransferase MoeA [Syntrophomonadaceae bacterium]|jgi:molybdopterin molybdotransferase|nr:molybdopterin molybdotransferase MoeA [Syntrophomonadaceae bacterium]
MAISLEDAVTLGKKWANPLDPEYIDLNEAVQRISAQDFIAPISVPGFDRSAVDGLAVCQEDLLTMDENSSLQCIAQAMAGTSLVPDICRGETVRVMTGAMLPRGTAAVYKQEEVIEKDGLIYPGRKLKPGANIQVQGSDIPIGIKLLAKGVVLDAERIERMACCGVEKVLVYRRPRVYIINTGNELVLPGKLLQPGQIYHSNRSLLAAKVALAGATPVLAEVGATDEEQLITEEIQKGINTADMVIISGGTGSGLADLVQESLGKLNASSLFKGIDIIPGRSSAAAVYKSNLIYNLAGRPGAVSLLFEVLIKPVLFSLQGALHKEQNWFEIILEAPVKKISAGRCLRRAEMIFVGPSQSRARPLNDWNIFPQELPLVLDLKPGQGKAGEVVSAMMI